MFKYGTNRNCLLRSRTKKNKNVVDNSKKLTDTKKN